MNDSSKDNLPPVKVGDTVSLRAGNLAAGGDFVGRLAHFPIFIAGAAPAETVKVEITEVAKTFGRGRVVAVEAPSADRIQPRCAHFEVCGGCDLQHIYYPAQLAQKTLLVKETLKRIGGFAEDSIQLPPAAGMQDPWHYRNKAEYFAGRDNTGKSILGFLRQKSREVVAIEDCPLQHPLNEKVRRSLGELLDQHAQGAQDVESLIKVVSRVSFSQEKACVTLITLGRPEYVVTLAKSLIEQVPEVSGVCHSRTRSRSGAQRAPAELVTGEPQLIERVAGFSYRISPDSFFQVNPVQTRALIELVDAFARITEEEILIDAYSGVGTFLIPLAAKARMATGIEESKSALADAQANIRHHHLKNARVYEGKVENILPRFAARNWHAGVVVLDPPRKGCGRGVIVAAAKMNPRSIVMVSCDPATLARDLRFAADNGFTPKIVQIVDMFPHTWHTESIALCVGD